MYLLFDDLQTKCFYEKLIFLSYVPISVEIAINVILFTERIWTSTAEGKRRKHTIRVKNYVEYIRRHQYFPHKPRRLTVSYANIRTRSKVH